MFLPETPVRPQRPETGEDGVSVALGEARIEVATLQTRLATAEREVEALKEVEKELAKEQERRERDHEKALEQLRNHHATATAKLMSEHQQLLLHAKEQRDDIIEAQGSLAQGKELVRSLVAKVPTKCAHAHVRACLHMRARPPARTPARPHARTHTKVEEQNERIEGLRRLAAKEAVCATHARARVCTYERTQAAEVLNAKTEELRVETAD